MSKRIDQLNENLDSLTGSELIPIFDSVNNTTERISVDTLRNYVDSAGETRVEVNDIDYTISGGTSQIVVLTNITATRYITLPPATTPNQRLRFIDESNNVRTSRQVVFLLNGNDRINGDTQSVANFPGFSVLVESNGRGKWSVLSTTALQLSSGINTSPTFTDNGDGSITIGNNGVYSLYSNSSGVGRIKAYIASGLTTTFLPDNSQCYVVGDYNDGVVITRVTTNVNDINETTVIPLYTIFRDGTDLHIHPWDNLGIGLTNKIHRSIVKTQRYRVQPGGLILGESSGRIITVTSGTVYVGAVENILPNTDSNGVCYFYKHVAGVWSRSTVTQYDNNSYDNGTDLVTLNPNRFATNFIYRSVGLDNDIAYVLGQGSYTLGQAQVSQPPANLPSIIVNHMVLVGRIIVEKGSNTATQIDILGNINFSPAGVSDHNSLQNLQGGIPGSEFYHLPEHIYNNLLINSGSTFNGNTSGDCITDLWVSNVYGCSPVTFHNSIKHSGSTVGESFSVALGYDASATGVTSFSLGYSTKAYGDYSHAEGRYTIASGNYSHAQGNFTTASGLYSHAEGGNTVASGQYSHAEGNGSMATGTTSHAEGLLTLASGGYSHAEGSSTRSSGLYSHAEGSSTIASGSYSHAEGSTTIASGDYSHAEGQSTVASGSKSHAEGSTTLASGQYSHAEGFSTSATTIASHAEGANNLVSGSYSHVEGRLNTVSGSYSHGEGRNNIVSGLYSHVEGSGNTVTGSWSHAEGYVTLSSGDNSHSEGYGTVASGNGSHAEGGAVNLSTTFLGGTASGSGSHAEGVLTLASGVASHVEGFSSMATGSTSHAEGYNTVAGGDMSHSEGTYSIASGNYSHAEGSGTIASGVASHAEGDSTTSSGVSSHAEGVGTTSSGNYSHSEGNGSISSGDNSHAEGNGSVSSGLSSHAQGYYTNSFGQYSHAGGYGSTASGDTSFVHSTNSVVTGNRSVVLGGQNITGSNDDTVYVPKLNVGIVSTGSTSTNLLTLESNGNITTRVVQVPLETIVNISSAQILAMGTSHVTLLPAPGAGNYYEGRIVIEYNYGTTQYEIADMLSAFYITSGAFVNTRIIGVVSVGNILTASDMVVECAFNRINLDEITAGTRGVMGRETNNGDVRLYLRDATLSSINPTLGDGTLRAIITYTIRTFGS